MFVSETKTVSNDLSDSVCAAMIARLEDEYKYLEADGSNDITGEQDFILLHQISKGFYKKCFTDIYENYVPLYHSLWKLRLKNVSNIANIHQDGGVHYFSKNGYDSRMLTIWTNIYRDEIENLSPQDMGIFVVDNQHDKNTPIYGEMSRENSHFVEKRKGQLSDCMHVCGPVLSCDTQSLHKTYLAYGPGASILFNSHLLHGSSRCEKDMSQFSASDLEKFRVSLTSVWIHKEDLDSELMALSEAEHENVYLSRVKPEDREEVKQFFSEACALENYRINRIKRLIDEFHTNG